MGGLLVGLFVFSAGALLIVWDRSGSKTAALATRLAATRGEPDAASRGWGLPSFEFAPPVWLDGQLDRYRQQLRLAGGEKTLGRFMFGKLVAAVAVPLIPLVPYLAVTQRLPSPWLVLLLAHRPQHRPQCQDPDLGGPAACRPSRQRQALSLAGARHRA